MTATLANRGSVPAQPIRRENVVVVRSLYAAFGRLAQGGNAASYVARCFHPDCEYRPVEETATIRGHDALIRWVARWFEAWEHAWDQVDEIIEVGETVVAAIRSTVEVAEAVSRSAIASSTFSSCAAAGFAESRSIWTPSRLSEPLDCWRRRTLGGGRQGRPRRGVGPRLNRHPPSPALVRARWHSRLAFTLPDS
jgi:hypothetical protein